MKLTMLGTGNAVVTKCYNTCFVLENEGQYLLVDGGGGITLLKQLKAVKIEPEKIKSIFVTHKHTDHILGIVWMLRIILQSMARGKYEDEVYVYGHDEVISILKNIAMMLFNEKETAFINQRLHFVEVSNGETKSIIGKNFTFFDIQSSKAKQYGFSVDINEKDRLCCCGDEPYNECEAPYATNAKWLLHEAFCLYGERDLFKPYQKHHSTVKDACELAEALQVENLILYHTEEKNLENRKKLYFDEGIKYYTGKLYIPDDLEEFEL